MDHRIKDFGGDGRRKRKSLDLKSLYNSRVSNVGRGKKRFTENNDLEDVKRRRKSGKEVSLSCLDSDTYISRECDNTTKSKRDFIQQPTSSGSKLLHGISFSLGKNGKTFNIPKKPRGLVVRKRMRNDKSSESLKLSNPDDLTGIFKPNQNSASPEQDNQFVKLVPMSETNGNNSNSKYSGDTTNTKLLTKEKLSLKSNVAISSSNSQFKCKASGEAKKRRNGRSKLVSHEVNEDTPVIKNGDLSSKKSPSICKKEKELVVCKDGGKAVVKKPKPSLGDDLESDCHHVSFLDDDDEENLEQNAARMLSSRFDPSCTGFSSVKDSSTSDTHNGFPLTVSPSWDSLSLQDNSLGTLESTSTDDKSRSLRPRSEGKGKGVPRKRRHFYEVNPDDLDAHWFLNRKIKVFWPLDESWYYGVVNGYHPECKLYHIKYDDRDEEWVDLHEEKFKLLLLPSEVPGRTKPETLLTGNKNVSNEKSIPSPDDKDNVENSLDSESIASWLARSSRNIKSLPKFLEKRKSSIHFPVGYPSSSGETFQSKGKLSNSERNQYEKEHLSSSADKLLCGGSGKESVEDMHVGPLSHENDDLDNKFSCAKGAQSDLNGESTSVDKLLCERIDQSAVCTSTSFQNCTNMVYVRRKYSRQHQTYFSLSRTSNLHYVSQGTVSADKVLFSCADGDDYRDRCFESNEPLWLIESNHMLRLPILSEHIRVKICIPLLPFLKYLRETCNFFIIHNMLMLRHGFVVATSPGAVLEMLFTGSNLGLKFFIFEGSLKQALALVFRILIEFSQSDDCWNENIQLPVTSIRFRLSSVHDLSKKHASSFYSFSRLQKSKWLYLDSEITRHCYRLIQLPFSQCSHDNIKKFECWITKKCKPHVGLKFSLVEVDEYISFKPGTVDVEELTDQKKNRSVDSGSPVLRSLSSFEQGLRRDIGLASNLVENIDPSENLLESNLNCAESRRYFTVLNEASPEVIAQSPLCKLNKEMHERIIVSSYPPLSTTIAPSVSDLNSDSGTASMTVNIPSSDQVDLPSTGRRLLSSQTSDIGCNINDDCVHSLNSTYSMNAWCGGNYSIYSSPRDFSPLLPDGQKSLMRNGFSYGPKKPRTQVQYTLPSAGYDLNSRQKLENHGSLHCKRIRKASQRRMSEGYKGNPKNFESLACEANVLVTHGDKGWRESGALVFLEVADQNEWIIAVKFSGITKYSYKVKHILQPGSTNRFSHAMMWRGGNDWVLEFPDRRQWTLFKEMHEECYNRNIRAASMKHIPIPGVWLVEVRNDSVTEVPFVRNSARYFRQVQTDVEMATDPSHVLYDLDSEDEQWLMENKICSEKHGCEEISEDLLEKFIDMFEKVSYAQHRDNFTNAEIEELVAGTGSLTAAEAIYKYWRQKKEKKGMPLIRHLQPPLWDRYQQQLKEWEISIDVSKGSLSVSPHEKPPMFAFCLKPRGLEVPNKGSKQRSHRKFSVSGHHQTIFGDPDSSYAYGRRSNEHVFGDEKFLYTNSVHESFDVSPSIQASMRISPRDAYFPVVTNVSDWNSNPKAFKYMPMKVGSHPSYSRSQTVSNKRRTIPSRNGIQQWNMDLTESSGQKFCYSDGSYKYGLEQLDGFDLHEFRLRDASRAAQQALKVARLKRDKAQRLFSNAEFAIHKAAIALMTAEAMKAADENSNNNN